MEKHYFNAKINKIGTKLIFVHELTYTLYIYIYIYISIMKVNGYFLEQGLLIRGKMVIKYKENCNYNQRNTEDYKRNIFSLSHKTQWESPAFKKLPYKNKLTLL